MYIRSGRKHTVLPEKRTLAVWGLWNDSRPCTGLNATINDVDPFKQVYTLILCSHVENKTHYRDLIEIVIMRSLYASQYRRHVLLDFSHLLGAWKFQVIVVNYSRHG